jgi:hypothetical protein
MTEINPEVQRDIEQGSFLAVLVIRRHTWFVYDGHRLTVRAQERSFANLCGGLAILFGNRAAAAPLSLPSHPR